MTHATIESSIAFRDAQPEDALAVLDLVARQSTDVANGTVEYTPLWQAIQQDYSAAATAVHRQIEEAQRDPAANFARVAIDTDGSVVGFASAAAGRNPHDAHLTWWRGLHVVPQPQDRRLGRRLEIARRSWAVPLGRAVVAEVVAGENSRAGLEFLARSGFQPVGIVDAPKTIPPRHYLLIPRTALPAK